MTEITESREFIHKTEQGFRDGSLLEWGITMRDNHRIIGTCAFDSLDKPNKRAEIGFALYPDYWGRGLMKEFLPVFIMFGFRQIGLHRTEADVDPRNKASLHLLKSLGFKQEGYLRERYHMNGEIQDAVLLGILRSDFEE